MLWHSFPELWGIEPRKGPGQWGQKEPQLMRWDQNGCRLVALLREEGAGDPFIPDASKREECAETNMSPFLVSPPRCAVPSANTWAGPRSLALPPLHLFFLPPTSTCLLADSECWVPRAFLSRWGSGRGRPPGHGPLCPHTLLCSPFAHAATMPRSALGKAPRVGWRSCDLSATSLVPSFPRTLEQRLPVHGPRCPAERPRFGAGVGGVVHPAWAFSWKLSFLKGPCFLITAIDACALVTA